MTLFVQKDFIAHSGQRLGWKIECDALTDDDLACLAAVYAKHRRFSEVVGVPRGGLRFAEALRPHRVDDYAPLLIVDDVLTTGESMEAYRQRLLPANTTGVVLFARGPCPEWVDAIFRFGL